MTRHKQRRNDQRAIHGWVNFDKPLNLGSTSAVGKLKYLFQAKKAGHAGTLDPLATGILPIALGEATKTVSFMQQAAKTYRVTMAFDTATSTDDLEGEIIACSDKRPTNTEIKRVLKQFTGEIEQVPPQFSAIRQNGQRAYALARAGMHVVLAPRRVRIDTISLIDRPDRTHASLEVACGKGVYMRALVRDLAVALGSVGHVTALHRARVGPFHEKNAIGLEKLESLGHSAPDLAALDACLLPVMTALDDIPELAATPTQAARIKQGQTLSLQCIAGCDDLAISQRLKICLQADNQPVAICQVDGGLVRPLRVFNL